MKQTSVFHCPLQCILYEGTGVVFLYYELDYTVDYFLMF